MRRRAIVRGGVLVLAAAVCLAGVAAAADDDPPCLADAQRLCPDVPPVGEYVQTCLEAKQADLSANCRKHVGTYTRDAVSLVGVCGRDIDRLCAKEPISGDGNVGCLIAHRDALSTACRDVIDKQSRE